MNTVIGLQISAFMFLQFRPNPSVDHARKCPESSFVATMELTALTSPNHESEEAFKQRKQLEGVRQYCHWSGYNITVKMTKVAQNAQICPELPRMPRIAQNAQDCPKCPDLPKMSKVPKMPRFSQNCPECPDLPRMPRIAKNAQNCPDLP